jgi:hypothetical protein
VFEKFADYVPRQEPNSWLAGGQRMLLNPHRMDRDARMKTGPLRAGSTRLSSPWAPCTARLLPEASSLAQQRHRDRKGPAAFLLGVGNKTT